MTPPTSISFLHCLDCGRPIAREDSEVQGAVDAHCFRHVDPDGKKGTDFEAHCLRLTVGRLREQLAKVFAGDSFHYDRADYRSRLRDGLTGQALAGTLAAAAGDQRFDPRRPQVHEGVAAAAVAFADATMAALGHTVKP